METERVRGDGRDRLQIRPVSVRLGVLKNADGSALFECGETRVLAAVHGPVAAKGRLEQIDRATVTVTVESLDLAPSLKDVAMARRLERTIDAVVFGLLNPRSHIAITIQPLKLDGSYFATAVNAAVAAVLDSGVSMKRIAFAGSCLCDDQQVLLVDPDAAEEAGTFASEHMAVFDPRDTTNSVAMHHFGRFAFEQIPDISAGLVTHAIMPVAELVTAAIRAKIERL